MAVEDQIIGAESGGNPTARNPNSSATGVGQFIDSTWLDMVARNRPDLMQGRSRDEVLALRNDPDLSREMTGAYSQSNTKALTDAGLTATPGNVYLAHFAGPQGAIKLLTADPNTPASAVMGDAAARANPFMRGMSVADLARWASGKVGGNTEQPAAAAAGAPAAAPMASASPPMTFGSMAPATPNEPSAPPQQQAQQQAAPQPSPFDAPQQQPESGMGRLAMPLTAQAKQRLFAALAGRLAG